jgi:hypothetical protein
MVVVLGNEDSGWFAEFTRKELNQCINQHILPTLNMEI